MQTCKGLLSDLSIMPVTFLRFLLADDQIPYIELQCLNVGASAHSSLAKRSRLWRLAGGSLPKILLRRADERTRTAYPCSLRVIHQALQGFALGLQILHI